MAAALRSRNVLVNGRRTSMRLEPEIWSALAEIARRERLSVHRLCSLLDDRPAKFGLSARMRLFALAYFRLAASEPHRSPLLDRVLAA